MPMTLESYYMTQAHGYFGRWNVVRRDDKKDIGLMTIVSRVPLPHEDAVVLCERLNIMEKREARER